MGTPDGGVEEKPDDIKEIAKTTAAALAKEVYSDALKPTVSKAGKLAGDVFELVSIPFQLVLNGIENIQRRLSERVARKLPTLSGSRALPASHVILPIIVDYALLGPNENENEELRDLFAGLLATTIDQLTTVHPSFRSVITQLTPLEARLLRLAADGDSWPVIQARLIRTQHRVLDDDENGTIRIPVTSFRILANLSGLAGADRTDPITHERCVDNFIRLGLMTIDWDSSISERGLYEPLVSQVDSLPGAENANGVDIRAGHAEGILGLTQFGRAFLAAVVRGDI